MTTHTIIEFLGTLGDFLDYASKATPVILTIAGLLGYYYREKVKALLAKSLAVDVESLRHQFAKELADHTSTLQREMESYKVSLIAEAERVKASQDVRKAIALRTAERRFAAIAALLDAHLGLDTDVCAHVSQEQSTEPHEVKEFLQRKKELHGRLTKYNQASDSARLFMSRDLRGKVLVVRKALLDVLRLREAANTPKIPETHEAVNTLLDKSIYLERDLEQLLREFEQA